MPRDRRPVAPGGTYFFPVVADRLRALFADPWARRMLGSQLLLKERLIHSRDPV